MFTSTNLWIDSMLFYCCVFYPLNAISEACSTAQHLARGRKYAHLYIECILCRPGWFFGESYMNMCRDRGTPPPQQTQEYPATVSYTTNAGRLDHIGIESTWPVINHPNDVAFRGSFPGYSIMHETSFSSFRISPMPLPHLHLSSFSCCCLNHHS